MKASEDPSVKIIKQLDGLGFTPYYVARNLKLEGVGGIPNSTTMCPIANYLKKHFSEYKWQVNERLLTGSKNLGFERLAIRTPKVISDFIIDFDSERIKLVEGSLVMKIAEKPTFLKL